MGLLRARRGGVRSGGRGDRARCSGDDARPAPATSAALARRRGLASSAWLVAWLADAPLADWASFTLLGLERGSQLGEAVAFFLLDVPKVLLLLLGIVTVVTLIRGFFPPERVRAALAGRGAAGRAPSLPPRFGIVTPVLLLLGGAALHRLRRGRHPARRHVRLPDQLADGQRGRPRPAVGPVRARASRSSTWPPGSRSRSSAGSSSAGSAWSATSRTTSGRSRARAGASIEIKLTLGRPLRDAWAYTKDLVRRIAPYLLVGIGIGAFIHGYVPTELVAAIGGRSNPLAVPHRRAHRDPALLERRRAPSRSSRRCSARACRWAPPSPS